MVWTGLGVPPQVLNHLSPPGAELFPALSPTPPVSSTPTPLSGKWSAGPCGAGTAVSSESRLLGAPRSSDNPPPGAQSVCLPTEHRELGFPLAASALTCQPTDVGTGAVTTAEPG